MRCPKCGRAGQAMGTVGDLFFCPWCQMQYDNHPEEGGTHYSDPTKRIEKEDDEREQRGLTGR